MQCLDLPINKLVNEQIANNAQWSQCVNIESIPMKCLADVSGKVLKFPDKPPDMLVQAESVLPG